MTKNELRKISLKFRTLSSQMLKIDAQEDICFMQSFYDYITETKFIYDYIVSCHTKDYDFETAIKQEGVQIKFILPTRQEELIDFGYQLIKFILESKRDLFWYGFAYSSSNKFADKITAFMRKVIEPFVIALRSYLEICLIDAEDRIESTSEKKKTIFISYCQKDSPIADKIEEGLMNRLKDQVHISRDVRDVAYHESFGKFMRSIEEHDYVVTIVSDRYLKSRNCMYEVLEVVKDNKFREKLIHIVLCDKDNVYLKEQAPIGAQVYSTSGQAQYSLFWAEEDKKLQQQIDALGNPAYAIAQIKEKRIIQKILLDLPEYLEFIKDNKGLSLSEHLAEDFENIIKFMGFNLS